jgi:hypothetical protein
MTFSIIRITHCLGGIIGFLQATFGSAEVKNKPNSEYLELNFEHV